MQPDEKSFTLAIRACDQCDPPRSAMLFEELALSKGMTRSEAEDVVRRKKRRKGAPKAAAAME